MYNIYFLLFLYYILLYFKLKCLNEVVSKLQECSNSNVFDVMYLKLNKLKLLVFKISIQRCYNLSDLMSFSREGMINFRCQIFQI